MKKLMTTALMALAMTTASAQTAPNWINNVKLSGYAMTQYQYSSQENNKSNSFNLRLGRVSLDGRILDDFAWKAQIQFNGNTSTLGTSPRLVDLFVEWQKYDFFRVKVGEFKNAFTFENPMNPIDIGFMSNAQVIQNLSNMSDRTGQHPSNGRDIGIQVQGDFLKNASDRNLLHYQIGVFNGNGINTKDVDQQKNVIGGVWVMPVQGMRIGAFGYTGSYARKGTWTDVDGTEHSGIRSLPQRRYAISAEYKRDDWDFRSEYIHSTGKAFTKTATSHNDESSKNCNVNEALGSKAQGVYARLSAPIIKNKFHAKVRYDMYQPTADASQMKTQYEFALDYTLSRNLILEAEYALVNDRALEKDHQDYSILNFALNFRF